MGDISISIVDVKKIANGPDQFLARRRLQDKSIGTGVPGRLLHLRRIVHAEHHDFDGRGDAANFTGGFQAIHDGHGYIKDDGVRMELLDLGYRVLAVFGLAANLEARLLRQDHAQAGTHSFVVIC
jgi:hypothetical protein